MSRAPSGSSGSDVPARILLVEDEEPVRRVTARLLERLGFEVVPAGHAEEALEIVGGGAVFDLVMTDVVMPGLSGIELAEEVHRTRPRLPFLFVSGYTSRDFGADPGSPPEPFLPKPFSLDDLSREVRAALGASHR